MVNEGLKVIGEWYFFLDDGKSVIQKCKKNLVTNKGLEFLSSLLIGEQDKTFSVYLAMGSGKTPPQPGDAKLENETLRKIVSTKQRQGNMVRFRTFFLNTEANGQYEEFGIFVLGSDAKDSGTLFNRLCMPISKFSNQVLSVEARISFIAG
jgi:hypothetical protein